MMISALLILAILFLSFSSGLHDTIKAVTPLYGSKAAKFYTSRTWAVSLTLLGSIAAIFLAGKLAGHFSGAGLVPPSLYLSKRFIIVVTTAAAVTILGGNYFRLPVAATHTLIGALVGSALVAAPSEIQWHHLFVTLLLPVTISPVVAVGIAWLSYFLWRKLAPKKLKKTAKTTPSKLLHFGASGWVCFNRGLNDTPKFLGLAAFTHPMSTPYFILGALVSIAMAIGGNYSSKPLARSIGKDITRLKKYRGLIATLVTGSILTIANALALPASMTHINVSAIYGVGLGKKKTNSKAMLKMMFGWIATLPIAALVGAGLHLIATLF